MPQFSPDFDVISKKNKKKVFDVPQTDLSVSFPWAPEAHGPLKLHGPRGHCPPLGGPASRLPAWKPREGPFFRIACF